MIRRAGLLFLCGLLPGWATAQIATDTCCRPSRGRTASSVLARQAAPPAVLPTCYAPVLATPTPLLYDPSKPSLPVFKWKSGAPIYATDEQFMFQLVALPSNKVLLEQTTSSHQVDWPPPLKMPVATTSLTYTIRATRRDAAGEQCFSSSTKGTLHLVASPAVGHK